MVMKLSSISKNDVFIFAYAQLKPEYYPPKHMLLAIPDIIYGDMYLLEHINDAGAINIGNSWNIIHGYTMRIPKADLKGLVVKEHPQYRRIATTTAKGYRVYAWEYMPNIPPNAIRINNFVMKGVNVHGGG